MHILPLAGFRDSITDWRGSSQGPRCNAGHRPADVGSGSKAAFSARPTNVRSTSKSGVNADILEPPLSAQELTSRASSLRRGAKKHRIDIWFHTALMPANLITSAHFSVSSAINLLKSAGEPRNAVLPRSHVGVAEGGVDLPVELVDDLDGGISGCADAVPGCVGRARSCRARSGAPHLPAPAERPRPRRHPPLGARETPP